MLTVHAFLHIEAARQVIALFLFTKLAMTQHPLLELLFLLLLLLLIVLLRQVTEWSSRVVLMLF